MCESDNDLPSVVITGERRVTFRRSFSTNQQELQEREKKLLSTDNLKGGW